MRRSKYPLVNSCHNQHSLNPSSPRIGVMIAIKEKNKISQTWIWKKPLSEVNLEVQQLYQSPPPQLIQTFARCSRQNALLKRPQRLRRQIGQIVPDNVKGTKAIFFFLLKQTFQIIFDQKKPQNPLFGYKFVLFWISQNQKCFQVLYGLFKRLSANCIDLNQLAIDKLQNRPNYINDWIWENCF